MPEPPGPSGRLLAFATLLALLPILSFPGHPEDFTWQAFAQLPLEWPAIALALLIAPRGRRVVLRVLLVVLLGAVVLLRLADIGSYIAFDRRFSPLVEWHLLGDGWNLASASIGTSQASAVIVVCVLVLMASGIVLFTGLGAIARLQGPLRRGIGATAGILLIAGVAVRLASPLVEAELPVQADLLPELVDRSKAMSRSIADQNAFLAELSDDPLAALPEPAFSALGERDLIVLFVESYGRSFIDDEDLGRVASERLGAIDTRIRDAGLHVKSAWLESPIRGGRSWLAHATFASGLSIDNQARFDRLISSDRRSLYRLLGDAGWKTLGLNPAIVMPWPEGAWYGYELSLDFHTLGYAGQNFGWVTMPDQYTLSHFQQALREPARGRVAAELALISSHAPWTPLPRIVPWEQVGDGSIFDGSHRFGGDPVWSDRQQVRTLYAQSLDYTLETIGQYVALHGDGALVIVLGDHQPASIIAGWGRTADVPIHIFSDDPELLERLPDDWWSTGTVPPADKPSRPMASMRAFLGSVFEAGPPN